MSTDSDIDPPAPGPDYIDPRDADAYLGDPTADAYLGDGAEPADAYAEPASSNGTDDLLADLPGLARVAATAWWHTSGWALQLSLRITRRLLEAALSPSAAVELANDARKTLSDLLRELTDLDERPRTSGTAGGVARRVADAVATVADPREQTDNGRPSSEHSRNGNGRIAVSLREEGEELLRRSRDVHYREDAHPAYERILSEVAPDEGRILRLLLFEGPQPSVDIRTGGPVGLLRSRLLAPGLSMIGPRSGCRYVERVPAYLNNLYRLGLIWFSRETLSDPQRYQVLEAQPDVLDAIHSVRQAKVVRRSIHLTPFGEDFCRVALCEDDAIGVLPPHSRPPGADKTPQPPAAVSD